MSKIEMDMSKFEGIPYAVEEAVNRLRVNLSFLGRDIRKIMVISSMPNEGKSFVTMQLWRQIAEAEMRTILVDLDLRKSVMASQYGIKSADGRPIQGIVPCLSKNVDINEAICQTDFEYGDILPNIENAPNPSILLEGRRIEEMLDYMSDKYHYVLVDSPPLNLVSDGERIGHLCDGAVLVVRGGVTSRRMVKHSILQLERAGCPVLGIVLNRVGGSKGNYYYKYKGYGYYKSYGYGYGYSDEYYGESAKQ